jgi:tRNA(Ile2) C34 agmatinyltransferase TiaS
MAFETKAQVLERVLSQEKPKCPHCGVEMTIWEVPPFDFSDGLGWGTPYLFVCFNDECSLYVQGWANMEENYAQCASYRCINYPGTEQFQLMPVFSPMGGTGQKVDEQVLAEEEILKEKIKMGFSILADAYVAKDSITVVTFLLDGSQPQRVRLKAAEMIGDIGELEAIEPIKSATFANEIIQKQVDASVKKIHERHFTRECPFCAEVIKKRAKICKHCGQDVAGK